MPSNRNWNGIEVGATFLAPSAQRGDLFHLYAAIADRETSGGQRRFLCIPFNRVRGEWLERLARQAPCVLIPASCWNEYTLLKYRRPVKVSHPFFRQPSLPNYRFMIDVSAESIAVRTARGWFKPHADLEDHAVWALRRAVDESQAMIPKRLTAALSKYAPPVLRTPDDCGENPAPAPF